MLSRYLMWLFVVIVLGTIAGAFYWGLRAPASSPVDVSSREERFPQASAGQEQAKTPASSPTQTAAGLNVQKAQIEQRDPQGKLEWRVTARGELEFDKERQIITGRDITFEMLRQEALPCVIHAPVFYADYNARKITFAKGVRGQISDGSAQFSVGHLVYDFDTYKLKGTGGVRFIHGPYIATAREIVLDGKAKKVRLQGGVRFEKRG